MSVKARMDLYWNHDTQVGRRILKDIGWTVFADMTGEEFQNAVKHHRLCGSLCRFRRKYRRLDRRGHLAPVVERETDRQLKALEGTV